MIQLYGMCNKRCLHFKISKVSYWSIADYSCMRWNSKGINYIRLKNLLNVAFKCLVIFGTKEVNN